MRRSFVPTAPNSSLNDAIAQPAPLLKRRWDAYTNASGLCLRADAERDGKRSDAPPEQVKHDDTQDYCQDFQIREPFSAARHTREASR